MLSWSHSSHGSIEGLACSEFHICLLSLSLRKSYVKLAGLHQVNRSCWTDLVRNGSDVFVLKKPIGRVLTKPLCLGQSWPERTSELEANRGGSWRDWLQSMVSGASNTTSFWEFATASASFLDKARGEIFWPSRVTLLLAVWLCVARRKVMPMGWWCVGWASSHGIARGSLGAFCSSKSRAVISGTHFKDFHFPRYFFRRELRGRWGGNYLQEGTAIFPAFFFLLVKAFYKQLIKICIIPWQL